MSLHGNLFRDTMAYENLLKSVEESAEEKERIIREKTDRRIKEMLDEAHARAKSAQEILIADAVKKIAVEKNKETYLVGAEIKLRMIRLKETFLSQAFLEAHTKIAAIRNDPQYPSVFKKLAKEAIFTLDTPGIRIHIDSRDEPRCREIIREIAPRAEVCADLQCDGGLIVTSPDGNVVISNTLESRLERAHERLSLELYRTLFGG